MKTLATLQFIALSLCIWLFPTLGQSQLLCDDYSNPSLWTLIGVNTNGGWIGVTGNALTYSNLSGDQTIRVYRGLGGIIQNTTTWRAEFEFETSTINQQVHALLLVVSETNAHPDANTFNGPPNNNSCIYVRLGNPTNRPDGYYLAARSKFQTTYSPNSDRIPVVSNTTYYVRLERQDAANGRISLYSDPGRTQLVGTECFEINPALGNLNVAQHGVSTMAGWANSMTGTVDDLCFYSDLRDELCEGVDPCQIYPAFSIDQDLFCNVTFTDQTTYGSGFTPLYPIQIDFGDGSTGMITAPGGSVQHYYAPNKSYMVCMTAYGFDADGNCCSKTFCQAFTNLCDGSEAETGAAAPAHRKGVEEGTSVLEETLMVYPSPTRDQINLQSSGSLSTVQILDLKGNLILTRDLSTANQNQIDVSELANGMYLIKVEVDGATHVQKFIKQ